MLFAVDLIVCACVVAAVYWLRCLRSTHSPFSSDHKTIPGPKGLPVIGNLLDIPGSYPWLAYRKLGRDCNTDIVRLSVLGNNIVIVNAIQIATDLFEKRSSIYSDRAPMIMLNELIGACWGIAFRRYGASWRDARKLFHLEFHPAAVKRFRRVEEEATKQFMKRLLLEPAEFMHHIRHLAGAIIMRLGHGIDIQLQDDPFIKIGERALEAMSAATNAGVYMVDLFPPLKYIPAWFPGARFQRQARVWRKYVDAMYNKPYHVFRHSLASGHGLDSVAASMLENSRQMSRANPEYADVIVKSALASMYVGGADTTVSAVTSFFLAMVLYSDVQKKARAEMDQVIGKNRLPTFTDQPSLPYIEAIVREMLRWNPVIPVGVPHRLTEDDVYAGAMLHDELEYPDPETFNPDRYLKEGKINGKVRDPSTIAFGFGRRVCQGRFMAKESMWLTVACVIATMDISAIVGEDGRAIVPDGDYVQGLLCYPKPFPCRIIIRSKEHERLVLGGED